MAGLGRLVTGRLVTTTGCCRVVVDAVVAASVVGFGVVLRGWSSMTIGWEEVADLVESLSIEFGELAGWMALAERNGASLGS